MTLQDEIDETTAAIEAVNPAHEKEPIRLQLQDSITAQLDWQNTERYPHWVFGFIDDDCFEAGEGECYQPTFTGGDDDPMEIIYTGIIRYDLPEPADPDEAQKFRAWLEVQKS